MKRLWIHKFPSKNVIFLAIECIMYMKIQQKLRCLGCISNQTMCSVLKKTRWILWRTISWWKAFLPPQKENWAFFWNFSFYFLCFNGVFLTLKCRTLALIPPHGDGAAAILLKMDITKVYKYGKSRRHNRLLVKVNIHEYGTWATRFNPLWAFCFWYMTAPCLRPAHRPSLPDSQSVPCK